jgi:hypothetical protein
MKFLKQAVKVKRGSRVKVNFSKPSTVFLMTEVNFKKYKDGSSFKRIGGAYEKSPVEFIAPYDGTWYAIIEKGSHFKPSNVTGSVEVLPPISKEPSYFGDDSDWKNDIETETKEVVSKKSEAEQSAPEDEDENEEKE